MSTNYGPWATPINAGMNPQLSAFWKRRLKMLILASQTNQALSTRNLLWLTLVGALFIAMPTLRTGSAAAGDEKPVVGGQTHPSPAALPGNQEHPLRNYFKKHGSGTLYILQSELVRMALELTDSQKEKLISLQKEEQEFQNKISKEFSAVSSFEERDKKIDERNQETTKELESILQPHQIDRLLEIMTQMKGASLVFETDAREVFHLTDSQKETIKSIALELGRQSSEAAMVVTQPGQSPTLDDITKRVRENIRNQQSLLKDANEKIEKALTSEQREVLNQLKGKDVDTAKILEEMTDATESAVRKTLPPAKNLPPSNSAAEKPSPAAQAAEGAYKATFAAYETGQADVEAVYRWSRRWMEAELSDRQVAIRAHIERMEDLYKKIKALSDAGGRGGEAASLAAARYYVVEAQEMLQETKKLQPDRSQTAEKHGPAAAGGVQTKKQALDEFNRLYALKDGERLKRVPPPFSSTRLQYYLSSNPGQAESIPRGPDAMCLLWQDGKIKNWSMTFGGMDLCSLQDNLAGIYPQEIEGDAELLKSLVQGDWILRAGTPNTEILARLEEILNSECKLPVKLSLRSVERKVFVAKGKFHVQPSQNESGEYGPCVKIYGRKYSLDAHGGGSGNFDKFLKYVGRFMNRRVVGEVENLPREDFVWFYHGDYFPTKKEETEDRDSAVVLKNVTEQTGLTFTEESRSVPVLFVEKAK